MLRSLVMAPRETNDHGHVKGNFSLSSILSMAYNGYFVKYIEIRYSALKLALLGQPN